MQKYLNPGFLGLYLYKHTANFARHLFNDGNNQQLLRSTKPEKINPKHGWKLKFANFKFTQIYNFITLKVPQFFETFEY